MSIECACNHKNYTLHEYRIHQIETTHRQWMAYHPDVISPVLITCLCGGTYTFETQWKHLDAKSKNSQHQIWQKTQNPGIIREILVICYCGNVFKYGEFSLHKASCTNRDRGKTIYASR